MGNICLVVKIPATVKPLIDREEVLCALLTAQAVASVPMGGWLRAGRKARGVSQQQLAVKLGFKRQAWAQLEMSEAREAISLYSFRRAADAMGYDLVYYLVPRGATSESCPVTSLPTAAPEVNAWVEPELPTELR